MHSLGHKWLAFLVSKTTLVCILLFFLIFWHGTTYAATPYDANCISGEICPAHNDGNTNDVTCMYGETNGICDCPTGYVQDDTGAIRQTVSNLKPTFCAADPTVIGYGKPFSVCCRQPSCTRLGGICSDDGAFCGSHEYYNIQPGSYFGCNTNFCCFTPGYQSPCSQQGGSCREIDTPQQAASCTAGGKVPIDYPHEPSCNDAALTCCIEPTPTPAPCISGQINCGSWSTPQNTCSTNNAQRTCYHNAGSNNCILTPYTDRTTISNCSANYTCNAGSCQTTLTAHMFEDDNHNGREDPSEPGLSGVTVNLNTGASGTTDQYGSYVFTNLIPATYFISISKPLNSLITLPPSGNSSQTVVLNNANGNAIVTFGIAKYFSITGLLYNDVNQSQYYETPPDLPINSGTITITGINTNETISPDSNGVYSTGFSLLSGNYTVSYSNFPSGFKRVYPGNPGEFRIHVGRPMSSPPCNINVYHSASCDTLGNIQNLNIGLTNEGPTTSFYCGDARVDTGFIDAIHQTTQSGATCGSSGIANSYVYPAMIDQTCHQPGIMYSGTNDPDLGMGQASPDPYNWQIGTATYPETFGITTSCPTITTSYNYIKGQIESRILGNPYEELSLYCDLSDCTLPSSLPNGIFLIPSDLTLNKIIFPENKNFIFLIDGNLNIQGAILVPNSSTATFIVAKNIYVYSSVGNVPDSFDATIQGFYSTDGSFIINSASEDGLGICKSDGSARDKKLVITGSVVVNAACTGGSLMNHRSLCASDLTCSTIHMSLGNGNISGILPEAGNALNHLLNAFNVRPILQRKDFEQEIAP